MDIITSDAISETKLDGVEQTEEGTSDGQQTAQQIGLALQEQLSQYTALLEELKEKDEAEKLSEMTPEERLTHERAKFEAEMAAKQAELKAKANQVCAAGKVSEYRFPQECEKEVMLLIMADNETQIDEKAKTLRLLADSISKTEVETKFKNAGYFVPCREKKECDPGRAAALKRNQCFVASRLDPWQ